MKRQYNVKSKLKKSSGIYLISCSETDKVYIGETVNLSQRIQKHFSCLRHKAHSNPILQNIFNKYGEETFSVEVLDYVDTTDELELKTIEKQWQDKYPTCVSLDSNIIFVVNRTEEQKERQREQLDSIRDKAVEACKVPIVVYDLQTKELLEFDRMKDAYIIIEAKHLTKNLKGELIPYKNRYVGFRKDTFSKDKLKDILITTSKISVVRGEYNLINLLDGTILKFGSKNQFSLHFSTSPNDKMYNNYNNRIDFEWNVTTIPTSSTLLNMDIELLKTKNKFSSTINLKAFYEALKIGRNISHIAELCGIGRKKLGQAFQQRTKEEWITLIETAIARVKSV